MPERRWWLYIAAVFPRSCSGGAQGRNAVGQLLVAFATNCVVAVLKCLRFAAWSVTRPGSPICARQAATFSITAGVSPAVSALGGAFVPILGGGPLDELLAVLDLLV